MSTRPLLGRVWASRGELTDPGSSKYNQGWLAEVPTYEVLNFLQNRTDLTLLALAERGIMEWGSDVVYGLNSLVWDANGKIYQAIVANPSTGTAPSANPTHWAESGIQIKKQQFTDLENYFNSHKANVSNPHAVTAHQAGSYTKAEIDSKVSAVDGDMDAHIADLDNPHQTTAAEIGAVPTTGGTYSGYVRFDAVETGINVGAGDHAIHSDEVYVGFRATDMAMGIHIPTRRAAFYDAQVGTIENLLNETEYLAVREQDEPDYAVPTPDCEVNPLSDIHLKQGFGETLYTCPVARSYPNKSGITVTAEIDEPRFLSSGMRLNPTNNEKFVVDAPLNFAGFKQGTIFVEFQNDGTEIWIQSDTSERDDRIEVKAGAVNLVLYDVDGVAHTYKMGNLTPNIPMKAAYTFDAQTVKTYLNGVSGQGGDMAFTPSSSTYEHVVFGTFPTGSTATCSVDLRSFKTWCRVLTPQQICTL